MLDTVPKVKAANDEMHKFATDQQPVYAAARQDATTDVDKQQDAADFNKTIQDKQDQLLKPLVDETKSERDVARGKGISFSWSIAPTSSTAARTSPQMSRVRSK